MIYTASVSQLEGITRNDLFIKRENIYIITRSNRIAESATRNGWNYRNELSPSWDLFKRTKTLKEEGKWDEDMYKEFYVPNFIKEMKSHNAIKSLTELINKVKDGEDIYLVCFCSNPDMCHRSIVAKIVSMRTNKPVRHIGKGEWKV